MKCNTSAILEKSVSVLKVPAWEMNSVELIEIR